MSARPGESDAGPVGIAGLGAAGTALAAKLAAAGVPLVLYARTTARAEALATSLGATAAGELEELGAVSTVWLAVSDRAIGSVAAEIASRVKRPKAAADAARTVVLESLRLRHSGLTALELLEAPSASAAWVRTRKSPAFLRRLDSVRTESLAKTLPAKSTTQTRIKKALRHTHPRCICGQPTTTRVLRVDLSRFPVAYLPEDLFGSSCPRAAALLL